MRGIAVCGSPNSASSSGTYRERSAFSCAGGSYRTLFLTDACIGSGYYPRFAATLEEPTCLASRHKSLGPRQTGGTPPLHSPEEVELFLDACEIAIAGGQSGFALGGEGGGETVDVGEIEIGFEFGRAARELGLRWDQMDRQLGHLREKMPGNSRALVAPDRIVRLAPIDDAHEEFALAIDGELNELLDLFGAGTVSRKGHEGASVEDDTFHSRGRFMVWGASGSEALRVFAPGGAPRGEFPEPWSLCRGSRGDCG